MHIVKIQPLWLITCRDASPYYGMCHIMACVSLIHCMRSFSLIHCMMKFQCTRTITNTCYHGLVPSKSCILWAQLWGHWARWPSFQEDPNAPCTQGTWLGLSLRWLPWPGAWCLSWLWSLPLSVLSIPVLCKWYVSCDSEMVSFLALISASFCAFCNWYTSAKFGIDGLDTYIHTYIFLHRVHLRTDLTPMILLSFSERSSARNLIATS